MNLTIHISDAHILIFLFLVVAIMYHFARKWERQRVLQYFQDNGLLTADERSAVEESYMRGARL